MKPSLLILLLSRLVLSATAQQVTGSGTPNFIPKWTGSTTLGNSHIFQSGSMVGIDTAAPTATLTVTGPNGTTGAAAPTVSRVTGGKGGNLPAGTFGTAGTGGGVQFSSGNGGSAATALGGTGGAILIGGGAGGNCIPASVRCALVGGNGGSIALQPGAGGGGSISGRPGNVILAPTSGNVGIGEMSPVHTLEIKIGGTTLADAWTTRSSFRLKTNIHPLEGALDKIEQLQGVSYNRKDDGRREIGVVAEEVDKVFPEVVSHDPNTNEVQGVDYSRLAAVLIEAVKTQQEEIQQLRVRVEQLTAKVRQ